MALQDRRYGYPFDRATTPSAFGYRRRTPGALGALAAFQEDPEDTPAALAPSLLTPLRPQDMANPFSRPISGAMAALDQATGAPAMQPDMAQTAPKGGVFGALRRAAGRAGENFQRATGDLSSQDWIRMGMGLLAAGQDNDWSQAAEAVGGTFDNVRQRKLDDEQLGVWREDIESRRRDRARADTMATQQDESRAKVRAAIQDPTELAIFDAFPDEWVARNRPKDPMLTPDGVAFDPRTGKELYRLPDIVTEREKLENDLLRAQIAAQNRSGAEPSVPKQFGAMDAKQVYDLNTSAQAMQTIGLPQLYTLRENIKRAIAAAQVGGAIPANGRITLDRLFNGSGGDRANLETWNARILQPAIAMFAGTGPLANKELELALNAMSNPNMTADASLSLIDERIRNAERQVRTAQLATRYLTDNGGITGRVDAQGRDFATFLQQELGGGPDGPATRSGGQAVATTAPDPGAGAPRSQPKVGGDRMTNRTIGAPARGISSGAIAALRANPQLAMEFDAKYGTRANRNPSRRYLQRTRAGWAE
jgi:hypothetical protein